jgi:hypothetical protein
LVLERSGTSRSHRRFGRYRDQETRPAAARKLINGLGSCNVSAFNANPPADVLRAILAVAVRPRLHLGLMASTAGLVEAMRSRVRANNISTVRVAPDGSGVDDPLGYAIPRLGGQARPCARSVQVAPPWARAYRQSPDSPWIEEIEAEVAASSNVVLGDDRKVADLEGGRNGYR